MYDKEQYLELVNKLNYYSHEYYTNTPVVSDTAYDELLSIITQIETEHPDWKTPDSPNTYVGHISTENTVKHNNKLYSIYSEMNTTQAGLEKFIKTLPENTELIAEFKYDGHSVNLQYMNGNFFKAITRGDGNFGIDKTSIFKEIDIPFNIDVKNIMMDIVGEVYIEKKDFDIITGPDKKYKTLRSAIGGVLSGKDKSLLKYLKFVAYRINYSNPPNNLETQYEQLQYLRSLGFNKNVMKLDLVSSDINELYACYKTVEEKREQLPFDIDGVVYKVNEIYTQDMLGYGLKYPNWCIAQKFESKKKMTKVVDIYYIVGRTGVISTMLKIEPCVISGKTISTVKLDLNKIPNNSAIINDFVVIQLSGDVSPTVVEIIPDNTKCNTPYTTPTHCPCCGSKLIQKPNKQKIYCPGGMSCTEQLINSITYFCSKYGMNIVGLDYNIIKRLVISGTVKKFSDIYLLKQNDFINLSSINLFEDSNKSQFIIGKKTSEKLLSNINKSKKIIFIKFMLALGIPEVSTSAILKIILLFIDRNINVDNNIFSYMRTLDIEVYVNILGRNTGNYFYNYIHDKNNIDEIQRLLSHITISYC